MLMTCRRIALGSKHPCVISFNARCRRSKKSERLLFDGPDTALDANKALLLTMALHELATNAVKYGALSNGEGKVHVTWSVAGDRLTLIWREVNGPLVQPPNRKGFGSLLIAQATDNQALIEFAPDGVLCRLPIPLRD
jgi:two-component sensor histidine kinase